MRVLLIAVPIMDYRNGRLRSIAQDETRNCPPYGLYLLTNVLRAAGHEVVLLDLIASGTRNIPPTPAVTDADVIGIGATSMSWPTARDAIKAVRRFNTRAHIVLGGIHPTMFDQYVLRTTKADSVVRGEGEVALAALCDALRLGRDLASVPNLTWKGADGEITRNPVGPKLAPEILGDFPLPAYEDLPSGVYKGIAIESSRGCAFDCSFCSTSYRQSWRGMPPPSFADRLEQIIPFVEKSVYRAVHIIDDEFSMNPKRAIAIIEEIRRRGLRLGLVYDSRANDLLYDGYVETIADYTHQFLVGAECGYDEGLKLIGKGTTCEKLELAAAKLMQHGIADRADFSFILGLPWEGKEEVERTIAFATHLYSTYGVRILLQWYCQIPGSRLWDEAYQQKIVTEAMYDNYGFFRDLHLWHTSIQLTPSEVWEIEDTIEGLQWLSSLAHPRTRMIEHAVPEPVAIYFPREFLPDSKDRIESGLRNLREVSRPHLPGRVGVPQRHTYPMQEDRHAPDKVGSV